MADAASKKKLKLPTDIHKIVIELDKIDGKKLRRVSSTVKDGSVPSLTITSELNDLKLKKGDWVLVYTENSKIIIEAVAKQEK